MYGVDKIEFICVKLVLTGFFAFKYTRFYFFKINSNLKVKFVTFELKYRVNTYVSLPFCQNLKNPPMKKVWILSLAFKYFSISPLIKPNHRKI